MSIGTEKGSTCNRNGCKGIVQDESDYTGLRGR